MGFFSWKTSDTKRSIPSNCSERDTFPVYMITECGQKYKEDNYEGYGVFGGKDIYVLIAELNGCPEDLSEDEKRSLGISLSFEHSGSGDFSIAAQHGIKVPKLVEVDSTKWDYLPYPENCPEQGFFYDSDDDDYNYYEE